MYEITTIGGLGDLPSAPADTTPATVPAAAVALAIALGVVVGIAVTIIVTKPRKRRRR